MAQGLRLWLTLVAVLAVSTTSRAQPLPTLPPLDIWGPVGVTAAARDGHLLYLGGVNYVGPATGALASLDSTTAALVARAPSLTGSVSAVHALGDGGWVVAGTLRVGAGGSQRLLRVDAAGSVVPWYPEISGSVWAMASDTTTLYVAGTFGSVDGQSREGAAAFDLATGQLRPWNPSLTASAVSVGVVALVLQQGTVFLGGTFDAAHGQPAAGFVAVDGVTAGRLPHAVPPMHVRSMSAAGDSLYVLGGDPQSNAPVSARVSVSTAQVQTWNVPQSFANVFRIEATATGIYARDPGGVVVVDPVSAAVVAQLAFQSLNSELAIEGNALYLVDDIGPTQCEVVSYDLSTLAPRPWRTVCQGGAALAARGGRVGVAGAASVGGEARRGLAAIDLRTGRPTAFNPDVQGGTVWSLAVIASVVVAGGDFMQVGPEPQHGLAAFLPDGQLLPWRPLVPTAAHPRPLVRALDTDGRRLFAGGAFDRVAGLPRRHLVAFDLSTAQPIAWAPDPDNAVVAIRVADDTVYAAGAFATVSGATRGRGAAFNGFDLALGDWDPRADGTIGHVAVAGGRVALAGQFNTLRGQNAYGFGLLDAAQRLVTPVHAPTFARALAVHGDQLFVAADDRVVAMSISTGQPLPFEAAALWQGAPGFVSGMAADAGSLVLYGLFDQVAGVSRLGIGVFPVPVVAPPVGLRATVRGSTVSLAWAPPAAAAESYVVEAGRSRGAADVGVVPVAGTAIGGPLQAGTYFVRVRGVRGGRAGEASSEIVLTVPSTGSAPAAPGTLGGTVVMNAVSLAWGEAAGNAESYVIEAGTGPGRTNIGVFDTGVLDTRLFAVVPRGLYYLRIRARNAFGLSAPTNEIVLSVP